MKFLAATILVLAVVVAVVGYRSTEHHKPACVPSTFTFCGK